MVLFNIPQRRGKLPKQRPPADESDTQHLNGAATKEAGEAEPSDVEEAQPGDVANGQSASEPEKQEANQEKPGISESVLKLLPEGDRLPALMAQPIAGLSPKAEARRRSRMLRNQNRWRYGAPLVVPVITACVGGVTAVLMSKYGMTSAITSGLEASGAVGGGVLLTQKAWKLGRRELERRKNDEEVEPAE